MDPNVLNYVQYFETMYNTFFQGQRKFLQGGEAPLGPPGYGPGGKAPKKLATFN